MRLVSSTMASPLPPKYSAADCSVWPTTSGTFLNEWEQTNLLFIHITTVSVSTCVPDEICVLISLICFPRLPPRNRQRATLIPPGRCCWSLRGTPVMWSGYCVTWGEPTPRCPRSCCPSPRASMWPGRTRRPTSLSAATSRALESAGQLSDFFK